MGLIGLQAADRVTGVRDVAQRAGHVEDDDAGSAGRAQADAVLRHAGEKFGHVEIRDQ